MHAWPGVNLLAAALGCLLVTMFSAGTLSTPVHASESGGFGPSIGGGIIIRIPTVPPRIDRPRRPKCPRGTVFNGDFCERVARPRPECGRNMYFSKRRGRCLCRKGFTPGRGGCVTRRVECGANMFFSKRSGRCTCRKGFVPGGNGCVRRVACGRGEYYDRRRGQCLCRKGRFRHKGRCVTQVACGANAYFSRKAGDCRCRRGYTEIGGKCVRPASPKPPVDVVEQPRPAPSSPPVVDAPLPKPKPAAIAGADQCLPRDLYDMLVAEYGERPGIRPCQAACLPPPARFGEKQLTAMSERFGIEWCDACIRLSGYLPLEEVRRIEELAGITLCMEDGARMCQSPGFAVLEPEVTVKRVREIIRKFPVTLGKEGDLAVIVGNKAYGGKTLPNANAHNDAEAVATLLTEQLGYRKRNVIDLRDATLEDLRRVFGYPDGRDGELKQLFGDRKEASVFVYASSHGMSDGSSGKSYLLPVDGDPDNLSETALALEELYDRLADLGARTTMLAIEATFRSRLGPGLEPPNLPEQETPVLPDKVVPGLAAFTASDRDQHTLEDPQAGIGLFTRYLIEGLAGMADQEPTGNDDKRIDTVELHVFTARMVREAARKSFGMEQKPILAESDNLLIGRLAAN